MLNKFRSVSRVTEMRRLFKNFKFLSLYPAERTGARDNHHSPKYGLRRGRSVRPEKHEGATDKQSPTSSTLSLWLATTLCNLSNIRSDLGLDPDQLENC